MLTKITSTDKTLRKLEQMSRKSLTLGNLLYAIRQGEEMNQTEFAKQLGISKQYLCDLEHHRRYASPKVAAEYAQQLGYSEEQFIRLSLQDMLHRDGFNLTVDIHPIKGLI